MVTPIDPKIDMYINGAWTAIKDDVRYSAGVTINRGKSSEGGSVEASRLTLTLSNADGKYSPRNPSSPYFGLIGRNTPIRVSVPYGESYMPVNGSNANGALTVDAAVLDVTGDIDLRLEASLDSWRDGQALAGKYVVTGNQRSWAWWTDDNGITTFAWSPDGTLAARITISSTAPIPVTQGRLALRVTLDVNNGASGNTVTFYTSDSIGGSWTTLGSAVTTAGTTSIFSSTADLELGTTLGLSTSAMQGKIHAFQMRNGIAGTLVANPDFTIQVAGDEVFDDTTTSPRSWVCFLAIEDRHYRFHGEVSSWPQKWDISGNDVYVDLEAAGVMRRLGQGTSASDSALFKGITGDTSNPVIEYWPMEDLSGSYGIASGISSGLEGDIDGIVDLGSDDQFVGSEPIAVMQAGRVEYTVNTYTSTGETQVRHLLSVPIAGVAAGTVIARLFCSGSARRVDLVNTSTAGSMQLIAYTAENVVIDSTTAAAFAIAGEPGRVSIELTQSGANVNTVLGYYYLSTGSPLVWSEALTGCTVGRVTAITLAPNKDMAGVSYGHLTLQKDVSSSYDLRDQIIGYVGELSGVRMARLCDEQGVELRIIGGTAHTEPMGPQGPLQFLELLAECVTADMGMMYESRDQIGLEYRTRFSLYNLTTALELDYSNHELSDSLDPVDDDQNTRNYITVLRPNGSSARKSLDSGPLSVLAPPLGVGKYDNSVTMNVEDDTKLGDYAGWLLNVGTVDEARYPNIAINLRHSTFATGDMREQAMFSDVGNRITVVNVPSWMPPDDVTQLVVGYKEMLTGQEHNMAFFGIPESPYHVADVSVDTLEVDTTGSELGEDLTTTETDVTVLTTDGPVWADTASDAGEFPYDIVVGGEVMTVTAVSGTTSPQTFTVTRSANGIVKTHSTGAAVKVAYPMFVAL